MTRTTRFAMILMASALCTACGASYVPVAQNASSPNSYAGTNTGGSGQTGSGGGSSGNTGNNGGSGGTTGPSGGTEPLITEHISGVGYSSTSVTISTASILKMTFTPGVQEGVVQGTGVSPQYSELGVYIAANGISQNTGMLSNGLRTGQAQTSPVLDFSSGLSGMLQSVTITISNPNNDYFCLNFGYYCPWTQVYTGQPWNGTLQIQTDYTVPVTSGTNFL